MLKQKVLIVDDDQAITYGATLRLRASGYETLTARDGAEGIEQAIAGQPDVVLLDVRMPNVDGLCALRSLRDDERTGHIPVIMLSASLRDRQTALEAGAQFFLTKPYRSNDVLTAIQSVLLRKTEVPSTAKTT